MSSVSQIPNFGYAWGLTVTPPAGAAGVQLSVGSSAWSPEPMRIVFEVNINAYASNHSFWTAKIELFNLSAELAQAIAAYGQGSQVILSAGYQNPGPGVIFAGDVYQVLYERPEVVDSKITLMCYTGIPAVMGNFASLRGVAKMTQAALVAKMAAGANTPITIDPASQSGIDTLPPTTYPRARPFFGNPHDFINDVSAANNLQSWYGFNGLGISTMSDPNAQTTITYTPSSGILGVPQLTQYGVSLIVVLDPRLRVQNPPMQINLSASIIRQLPFEFPGYPALLNPSGNYLVNGLQFRGDSRGNQWETEIAALNALGGLAEYVAIAQGLDRRAPRGAQ